MKVTKRTILGKKLKSLRKRGLLPAVIYDKDTNISVQIPMDEFIKTFNELGNTGLLKIEIDSQKFNVLIDHVQIHPATRQPIHATLREVNLKEEINATVPINIINAEESKGVKDDGGIVVENISEVEIIALPTDIPRELEVDVLTLGIGEGIKLEDIKLPKGVRFATEDENFLSQIVVTVTHKAAEEVIEPVATEIVVAEGTKEKNKDEAETPSEEEKK